MPPRKGDSTFWAITLNAICGGLAKEPPQVQGHDPSRDPPHQRPQPEAIIENVNRTTIGWFEYFKHSHVNTHCPLDGWIRMRLRSILRRDHGRHGRGRGRDHQRWPNAFFSEHGFFSLVWPMHKLVNPVAGEPLTGEPDAGDPPVRFGGRGSRSIGPPYPYRRLWRSQDISQPATVLLSTRLRTRGKWPFVVRSPGTG